MDQIVKQATTVLNVNSDGQYVLAISSFEPATIKSILDKLYFPEPVSAYSEPQYQYVSLADMSYDQQQALLTAAKLFYQDNGNKINTIKHIRTLTMSCNLLEGKQLVEWAIGGDGMRPSWGKVTAW